MVISLTDFIKLGQGPSKLADAEDIIRDNNGYTNPNLHRRTYTNIPILENTKYSFGIYGVDSYRTVETVTHNEESTTSEIP